MNRTKIDWADFTWNPLVGCLGPNNDGVTCFYCYARKIAERFKGSKAFPNGFAPTWHPERLNEPLHVRKPSRIFAGSVTDFLGDWVTDNQLDDVFDVMADCPQHTFYLLTKQAQNIRRRLYDGAIATRFLHRRHLPTNVWLGVSVTCDADLPRIALLRDAWPGHKFVSFEPLLNMYSVPDLTGMGWVIVGTMTGPESKYHLPPYVSVRVIVDAADRLRIPIFIKNNCVPWIDRPGWPAPKRQEWPK